MKKSALIVTILAFGLSANAHDNTTNVVQHDTLFVDRPIKVADQKPVINGNVPYIVARNYYVLNESSFRGSKLITTKEEFLSIFGKAVTIGDNSTPTPIDFEKQCALAIVKPETNVKTEITPGKLTADDDNLKFSYNILQGRDQSFTTIPMLIIIIDKEFYRLNLSISSRVKHLTIDDDPDAVLQGVYD